MMKFRMKPIISKEFKIQDSIIISNFIFMMNNSFWVKPFSFKSFNFDKIRTIRIVFFQPILINNSMLSNITGYIWKWMVGSKNENISCRVFLFSTFPIRVFISQPTIFVKTFLRTIFSLTILKLANISNKRFTAGFTRNPFYIPSFLCLTFMRTKFSTASFNIRRICGKFSPASWTNLFDLIPLAQSATFNGTIFIIMFGSISSKFFATFNAVSFNHYPYYNTKGVA